jgi:hypothetical protein
VPLFWLVHEIDGARIVTIREDSALIFARLRASMDGFSGTFVEAHAPRRQDCEENSEVDDRARAVDCGGHRVA